MLMRHVLALKAAEEAEIEGEEDKVEGVMTINLN
jgi:hypothetical protein